MRPVHYTDLAQQTFERALENLQKAVSPPLFAELRELLAQGHLHDPSKVIAAIKKHAATEPDNVD